MINNVVLVGRLTKDPDLKYTSGGSAVATFSMAVQRSFTNQSGEREADFINCVIWRKPAEALANYTRKGSLIGVEGRIQTRNYENQQGQRVYVTEIVCENFQMLESKETNEQRIQGSGQSSQPTNRPQNSNIQDGNFQQESMPGLSKSGYNTKADPFANSSQIDINDEDLPF